MTDDTPRAVAPGSGSDQRATSTCCRRAFLAAVVGPGTAALAGCLGEEHELGERGPDSVAEMETSGRVAAAPLDSHPEELFPAASAFGEEWEVSTEPESTDGTEVDGPSGGLVAETEGVFVTEGRAKAMTLAVRVYERTADAERGVEQFLASVDANVTENPDDAHPFGDEILLVDWAGVNEHWSHLNVALFRKANVVVEAEISNNEEMTALRTSVLLAILDDVHASWAA